jgi:hypothetical protein
LTSIPAIDPNAPEVRLVAQLCGISPARFAEGLNRPAGRPIYVLTEDEHRGLCHGLVALSAVLRRLGDVCFVPEVVSNAN